MSSSPKVLVLATNYRELCANAKAQLEEFGCEIVENRKGRQLTFDELVPLVGDVDAVITGADVWNEELLKHAPKLKVISRFGVGVDSIDIAAANARGIYVTNAPGGNANAVAELTVGLIISAMRDLVSLATSTKAGAWERSVGRELSERTVGLLGFGAIARLVAKKLAGFEVKLIAYDKYPDLLRAAELKVEMTSFDQVITRADVVSMHMPSLPETRHAMGAEQFAKMKKTAVFINTARGAVVDEGALREALQQGTIAAAAVDVWEREPVAPDNPLLTVPNLIPTPHTASETYETYERVGRITAQAVMDVLSGRVPANSLKPN